MKKVLKVFTTLSLLALVMAGCDDKKGSDSATSNSVVDGSESSNNDSSNSSNISQGTDSSTSNSSNSGNSSSSSVEQESYSIRVNSAPNATVQLSKTTAYPGDIITISVTPDDGYIVSKIAMNNQELTSTSFVMPATSVRIDVVTTLINKDGITLGGDLSVRLEDEGNGIYVARNVKVEKDSNVYYTLDGGITTLSLIQFNTYKTFADISSSTKDGFTIAGNGIYDFYYDSNDLSEPCYVQRVGIINLPTSESDVAKLFSGEARSESTLNPLGVNKVEYYSSVKNEKYEWNLYSDNSSYAQITHPVTGKEKAIVYKVQEGNVYKVVDNYLEGSVDPTYVTRGDTTAFSGKYDIVDVISNRKYQYLQSSVDIDANAYSHTMESLDFEFYDAYRTGYTGNVFNDVTVDHNATVTSTKLDNGDFKVELDSWVRWDGSANYESTLGYRSAYITYELDVTFTAAGAIRNGSYTRTIYDTASYDFSSNSFKAGWESVEADKIVTFAYSYGAAKAGKPQVDVSKYFTSEISNVVVQGKQQDKEGFISVSEDIKASVLSASTYDTNMTFVCLPSTALDAWQYGTVASSNTTVIAPKNSSSPYDFRGVVAGTSDITIGNHTKNANDVTKVVTVTVSNSAYIKGIFMYTVHPYPDYDETFDSSKGIVICGNKYEIQLAGSSTTSNYVMNGLDITFEYTSDLFTLEYDNETGKMTIDATNSNVAQQTSVTVKVNTPYRISDWPVSTFTFTVMPRETFEDSLVGSWTQTTSNTYIDFTTDTTGTIYYVKGNTSRSFDFTYTYDSKSGKIEASVPYSNGTFHTLKMYIDSADGALCVCFYTETLTEGWESDVEVLIGDYYEDEYDPIYQYDTFFK